MSSLLMPEIILAVAAGAIYLAGKRVASRVVWRGVGLGTIAAAAVATFARHSEPVGPLAGDALGQVICGIALVAGGLLVMTAPPSAAAPASVALRLAAAAGLMLVGEAGNLVLLFVGLELAAVATCLLLYLEPAARATSAARYFLLSLSPRHGGVRVRLPVRGGRFDGLGVTAARLVRAECRRPDRLGPARAGVRFRGLGVSDRRGAVSLLRAGRVRGDALCQRGGARGDAHGGRPGGPGADRPARARHGRATPGKSPWRWPRRR